MVAVLSVASTLVGAPMAGAVTKPKDLWSPRALPAQQSTPVRDAVPAAVPVAKQTRGFVPAAVAWPAAASADISLQPPVSTMAKSFALGSPTSATSGPLAPVQRAAAPHAAAGIPVVVGAAGTQDTADALADSSAVRAALVANAKSATPSAVHVALSSRESTQEAGINGLLVSLSRTDSSSTAERVSVALDYSSFKDAFGGGYGDRLHLVAYPACLLTTPQVKACSTPTPVAASTNLTGRSRLVADLTLPASAPAARSVDAASTLTARSAAAVVPQAGVMLLGVTPDAAGSSGSFAASPVNDSSKWGTSGNSGAFTYSYPLTTPPAPGGVGPKLALSYNSQSVDGRTSATNGQGSWAGDGWTMWPGQVTRGYRSCVDDGQPVGVVDQCWAGDNATLTLNGASHQLVQDDASGKWRLKDDDGSQVFELKGSDFGISNGLHDNTFWALRDRTGTVYVFGADHLPGTDTTANRLGVLGGATGIGTDASTNAAWGAPVYGNNPAEPCNNAAGFNASSCMQGWQWNLDFVITPRADITVYQYQTETNYYAAGTTHTLLPAPYVRGGTLASISYGWKTADYQAKAKAAAVVTFTGDPAGRCSTDGGYVCAGATLTTALASHWPDVPFDQNCPATGTCTNYAPTFWTNDRLASITTQVWDTKPATPLYRTVDTYVLSSDHFPDPADGTVGVNNSASPKAMWLDSVTHTGNDTGGGGAAVPEKPVSFDGTMYANRVAGLTSPAVTALNRRRLNQITTETGAKINISYASDACSRTSPPAEDHDTKSCYPVRWSPQGAQAPILDWFNKYLVGEVDVHDNATTKSPTQTTKYEYKQDGAAWHRDDDTLTADKNRTWGEFRGYSQVTVRTGATPDPISESVTKYLQGMDGDATLVATVKKTASVTNDAGDAITDQDPWSGTAYESLTYDRDGGTPQARSMTVPWLSQPTAVHARSKIGDPVQYPDLDAYYTGTASQYSDTLIDAGATPPIWRLTDTVTTNDLATGLVTTTDDRGEVARDTHLPVAGSTTPEKCTTTTYAGNAAGTISALPAEVTTVTGPCGTATDAAHTVSDAKTFYDNSTVLGLIPATGTGQVTSTTALKDWTGTGGTARWTTPTAIVYDTYGRATSTTDALGRITKTAYLPAGTKYTPTSVTVTNPLLWTSTVNVDVARGLTTSSVDANSQLTTETYDGLGRLTQAWTPARPQATNASTPNVKYTYTVSNTGPSWVDSQKLRENQSYAQDYKIYDSLQQVREEQTTPPDATAAARLISDTIYDSHGKAVFADAAYFNSASAPNGTFTTPLSANIPQETTTVYDGMGRPLTATDGYNGVNQWTTTTSYPHGNEVDTVPPTGGSATAVITDARGQKAELRQYHGPAISGAYDATTYGYDAAGHQSRLQDQAGNVWTTAYDNLGDKVKSTDPDTGTSAADYNDAKQPVKSYSSRPNGYGDISTSYDTLGRATDTYSWDSTTSTAVHLTHTDFDPTGARGHVSMTTSYDTGGNAWTSKVNGYTADYLPTGTTTTVPHAALGSTADITYTTATSYYPIARTVYSTTLPAENTMPAETVSPLYNDNGLPVTLGNANTTYLNWMDYTHLGAPMDATMGTPGTQVVQSYTYTPGTSRLQNYTVDAQAAGSNTSAELDNVTYTYNDAGQKTSSTDIQTGGTTPAGTDTQCYQYDYLGRLTQAWTDTKGITTAPAPKILYDGACTTTAPSTSTLGGTSPYWQSYTYDTTGNRTSITDHSPLGAAGDNTTTSLYNATTTVGADGTAQTMPHGLASTTSTNAAGAQTLSYDAAGNTTEIKQASGSKTLASGATLASGTQLLASTARLVMQADGNLVIYSTKSGQKLWSSNTSGHPGATATMGTDGNLTVKDTTGTTLWSTGTSTPGSFARIQDDNQLVVYTSGWTALWNSGTWKAADAAADIKLSYDHNGRLATTTQGTTTTGYTYDAAGTLTARTNTTSTGTVTTLLLGADQITVMSGTITGDTRSYTLPGAPTTIRTSSSATPTTTSLHFQATDPQGTATTDISADNKTILRRMQTPYGTDRTPNGNPTTWPGTKGYLGGTQDNQTGLTNEGAREYSPTLGRFLSRDSVLDGNGNPQAWNGYAYANNNPIDNSDPSGLCIAEDNGTCIGNQRGIATGGTKSTCETNPKATGCGGSKVASSLDDTHTCGNHDAPAGGCQPENAYYGGKAYYPVAATVTNGFTPEDLIRFWENGSGEAYPELAFGPNSLLVSMLSDDNHNRQLDQFLGQLAGAQNLPSSIGPSGKWIAKDRGTGASDLPGLASYVGVPLVDALGSGRIDTVLGTYNEQYQVLKINSDAKTVTVNYHAWNTTGWTSFCHDHACSGHDTHAQFGATIRQDFYWTKVLPWVDGDGNRES